MAHAKRVHLPRGQNGLNSIDEIIIKEILNDEAADKETVQTTE